MYQLHVTVQEYPSVWRVFFSFSVTEPGNRVRQFGTRELWLEPPANPEDPLTEALRVLERACKAELRPNR